MWNSKKTFLVILSPLSRQCKKPTDSGWYTLLGGDFPIEQLLLVTPPFPSLYFFKTSSCCFKNLFSCFNFSNSDINSAPFPYVYCLPTVCSKRCVSPFLYHRIHVFNFNTKLIDHFFHGDTSQSHLNSLHVVSYLPIIYMGKELGKYSVLFKLSGETYDDYLVIY
ncbi:hypothetical protein BRLA_c018000 [Brevibacillus laterosporus LMG 15441]|uniref:Uncharacterized protein n=1 Tax=Brevibacillus laterosporus LMG 15441 TaxID=1042163 RepID=A0A075R4L2_BRELA|nr:hypothetical protein BRLA_c018000 [Brevibacillus laterosporus LMG 15441]